MSIMDMFKSAMNPNPGTTATAAPPANPGQVPNGTPNTGAATTTTAPNGVLPTAGGNTDTTKSTEPTPFAQFTDLWKNDDKSGDKNTGGVFGEIDPAKFSEAAGKINFSKSVTPEQLQAISSGGEGAVKAFAEAMNTVAQGVYAQSAFASTKIAEQAAAKVLENMRLELPAHMKKHTVSESLRSENPMFNNPAVQPLINALEFQLTHKFPNASAAEITTMAKGYISEMGTAFAPKADTTSSKDGKSGAREEVDWSSYLQ